MPEEQHQPPSSSATVRGSQRSSHRSTNATINSSGHRSGGAASSSDDDDNNNNNGESSTTTTRALRKSSRRATGGGGGGRRRSEAGGGSISSGTDEDAAAAQQQPVRRGGRRRAGGTSSSSTDEEGGGTGASSKQPPGTGSRRARRSSQDGSSTTSGEEPMTKPSGGRSSRRPHRGSNSKPLGEKDDGEDDNDNTKGAKATTTKPSSESNNAGRSSKPRRSNSQPKLVIEEDDDNGRSEIKPSDSGVSSKVSMFEQHISKSRSGGSRGGGGGSGGGGGGGGSKSSHPHNDDATETSKQSTVASHSNRGGGGDDHTVSSRRSTASGKRVDSGSPLSKQSPSKTPADPPGDAFGAFPTFASPSSPTQKESASVVFGAFEDMAAFSPTSHNKSDGGSNAFSSFDAAFATEPTFQTTTTTTTTATSSDPAFASDFDPHAFAAAGFADAAFDGTAFGGTASQPVWDKSPLTDVPPPAEPEPLQLRQTPVLTKQFHGAPVNNPATGTVIFCASNPQGVVSLHELDPARNFIQIASAPVLTADLRHKVAQKYGATVAAVERVRSLACGCVRGAQTRTRVAAIVDFRVLEAPGTMRVVAVWQWSNLQALQYVLTPPAGGDFGYDLATLRVAEGLLFLAGSSPKGACVFVSKPAVREAWSANFLTGAPGATVAALSVAPHAPHLAVALTDRSVTVWTFASALLAKKDAAATASTAAAGGASKRWLFSLCRLQHAKAMAAEKPAAPGPKYRESTAGKDDAGRCTHLAWLPSDPVHPALHLLAVGFENGFAVFHVELPILADGNKPIPEPTQSTVVSATPSLGPIATKRWLGAFECTFVSWLGLGPHVDPLIAVLMIDATSASVLLCAMNIPSYSQSLVAKANVLTCRILTVKEIPKGGNSFPGGLLQSCSARKALVCFTEQKLSTISLFSPTTKGLSPVATLDFPITSIPPGLSSFGEPFLVDAKSDKDGILHIFSTVHCERYRSKTDASMLPWSAPMRRTWLCRSVAGDTRETFVEETKEERGFGDSDEAFGGASADVICELNHEVLRGMAPTKIVRCTGSNVCAVLFRPAFASARSGKALAVLDANTIALVNFQESSPVIHVTKGRDIVFFPSEEDDCKSARGLVLSADGASLTFFSWTSGADCELSTSFRPIVGVDSDKDYIESKRIDLFVDGTKLSLGVLGKRNKECCFVTGGICDVADATSESWSKFLPNIVSGRSSWLEEGEEILSIVGLQGDGSGYRNFALATSTRVLILSSALTVAAETRRRISCANLAPIGNFAVVFSSEDKVRYLCCLDGAFVESGIATLSEKSYNAVLAVRPDRLLLSPTQACPSLVEPGRSPNSFIMPAPNTRVALMLEALIANAICVGGKQNQSTPVLRTVIEKFGRKGASLTHGEKEGIGQYGAGLTSKIFAMLESYGLKHSSSWLLTGVPNFERSVNCEILPAWLPILAKSKGAMNTDAMLHLLSNGDSYLSEYIKSPEQNMPAPLPRQSDVSAFLSAEYGQAALASGKGLDALKMFDLSGSESTETSLLLLSLLLEKMNGGDGSAGILESIKGLRESAFSRSSKTEKIPASLAALALSLKKAHGSHDFSMSKDEIDRYMKPLAPSLQRSRTSGRPRQRLLFEKDLESAAGKNETQNSDSFWATPCNESKHVWNEGPRREKENLLLLDSVEDWLGRRRPLILGREGASAAKDRGEKTLADILNQDDDSFGGKGDDLESVRDDTWVEGVGEGRSDEANLSGYFRMSEGDQEDSPWKTEGLLDLSPYQIRAVIVGEPETFSLQQSTSSVDEGEPGKVKSLFDLVFEKSGVDKASGLALPASRGGSIDVGLLHGPGRESRKRCSIEFWYYLSAASNMTKDIVLARRTMGSAADELAKVGMASEKDSVLWELLLRKTGELEFRTCGGSSLVSTQKRMESEDDDDNEKQEERTDLAVFERWNHVCITLSSRDLAMSECNVSIYMKGVGVASKKVSVLPSGLSEKDLKNVSKLDDFMQKSYLLFGLNHSPGFRMTELRVWACERSADDTSTFLYEYLTAAEQKKKFKVKISNKNKKGAALGKGLGFAPPRAVSGSLAQTRTMAAKMSSKDTGISLAPQFSLAPPKPDASAFSPEPGQAPSTMEPTAFEASFGNFGGSPSTFASPSAATPHESLPVVKEDADDDEANEMKEMEGAVSNEAVEDEEDVAGTLWDTAIPLSQQIRASAAAALIRGPPATRHYGGNRGGLPDYSGVDRFGVGGIAICGSEKTIVFRDNEDPPALTYPIGASGAVVSDQMDDQGSEFLCCFLAKEGRMVVFELRSRTVVVELQMTTKLNFWRFMVPEAAGNTLCFMLVTPVGGFHWMPLEESPRPHQVWKRDAELQGKKIVSYEEGGSNGLDDAEILSRVGLVMATRSSGANSLEGWLVPISGDSQAQQVSADILGACLCQPLLAEDGPFLPLLVTVHSIKNGTWVNVLSIEEPKKGSIVLGDVVATELIDESESSGIEFDPPGLAMGPLPEALCVSLSNIVVVILRRKGLVAAFELDENELNLIAQENVDHYVIDAVMRYSAEVGGAEIVMLLSDVDNPKDGRIVSFCFRSAI